MQSNALLNAGRDVIVLGGNFKTVVGETNYYTTQTGHASDSLLPSASIAFDALHCSEQRFPPPNCHPGTRDGILSEIYTWITGNSPQAIFWLFGTAGVGKSAILQTICERYLSEGGRVSAAFFFGRGLGKRGRDEFLVTTIAHQLAQNVSGYRRSLKRTLEKNPNLINSSIKIQFEQMIVRTVNAISQWRSALLGGTSPIVIVVDGLDECQGEDAQSTIIQLLSDASRTSNRPLRFLVASRPESHILRSFNRAGISSQVKRVALDDTFKPSDAIRLYLEEQFKEIVEMNSSLWTRVKKSWPGKVVIDILVANARGQFLYATLVITFVRMPRRDPIRQLETVLNSVDNHLAFSTLDALYIHILKCIPDDQQDLLHRTLACILILSKPQSVDVISNIIRAPKYDTLLCLEQLRAVLSPESMSQNLIERPIAFAHTSFRDFLLHPRRSGPYVVDEPAWHTHILLLFLRIEHPPPSPLSDSLPATCSYQTTPLSPDTAKYINESLSVHAQLCNIDYLLRTLTEAARGLFAKDPVFSDNHLPDDLNVENRRNAQNLHQSATSLFGRLAQSNPSLLDNFFCYLLETAPIEIEDSVPGFLGCISAIASPQPIDVISTLLSLPTRATTAIASHLRLALSPHLNSASRSFTVLCLDSFRTFLLDKARSGRHAVDPDFWRATIRKNAPNVRLFRSSSATHNDEPSEYPTIQRLFDQLTTRTRSPKFSSDPSSPIEHTYQIHNSIAIFLNGKRDDALDEFYMALLDGPRGFAETTFLHVVWFIVALPSSPTIEVAADMLGVPEGNIEDVLYRLRPVMTLQPAAEGEDSSTIIVHSSFVAYLKSRDRADAYALQEDLWHNAFVYRYLSLPPPNAASSQFLPSERPLPASACRYIESNLSHHVSLCNVDELVIEAVGGAYPSLLSPFHPVNQVSNTTPLSRHTLQTLSPAEYHRRLVLVFDAVKPRTTHTLDKLYLQILESVDVDEKKLAAILGFIAMAQEAQPITTIASYARVSASEVEDVLYQLRAVVAGSVDDDHPSFHPSFRAFLTGEERSEEHFIDEFRWNTDFVRQFLDASLLFRHPEKLDLYSAAINGWIKHRSPEGEALDYATTRLISHHAGRSYLSPVFNTILPVLELTLPPSLRSPTPTQTTLSYTIEHPFGKNPFEFHARLAAVCRIRDPTLLDSFYLRVMDAFAPPHQAGGSSDRMLCLRDVLGCVVLEASPPSVEHVADVTGFPVLDVLQLIKRVPMIVSIERLAVIVHANFRDFLLDSSRSRNYHISMDV